jgi:predicted transcriptional regulator
MKVVGMITTNHLLTRLTMLKVKGSDPLSLVMIRDFRNMSSGMAVSELSRVLERQNFVLVDGSSVASSYDVLNFMTEKEI